MKEENCFDDEWDVWENINWDEGMHDENSRSDASVEKAEIFVLPPEVLNRKPGHVFTMEDEIKVLKYLGMYDELPDEEK